MPQPRRLAFLALLAASAIPLAACAPSDHTLEDETYVIIAEPQPGPIYTMWAIIEGTLVEFDGCVGIEHVGGQSFPLEFPSGTTIEGDRIHVAGFDRAYQLGDWISGAGGTVPFAEDSHPAAPCHSDDIVVLGDGRAN